MLLSGIVGLALLDALNPATIACVALLLVSPSRAPLRTAAAFVVGAYLTVLALGATVLGGAAVLSDTTVVRRVGLTVAGLLVLVAAVRRLRTRHRSAVALPGWVGPWTAAPLGALVTGADLPNAFPYLVAIERLVAARLPEGQVLLVAGGLRGGLRAAVRPARARRDPHLAPPPAAARGAVRPLRHGA
jgi:hypothetical protein